MVLQLATCCKLGMSVGETQSVHHAPAQQAAHFCRQLFYEYLTRNFLLDRHEALDTRHPSPYRKILLVAMALTLGLAALESVTNEC